MSNRISTILAMVAVGWVLSGCASDRMETASGLEENEGLAELRQKLQAAYQSGDAAQMAALFTDNGVLIPSAGQEIKGRENIEQTFRTLWQNWKVVDFNLVPQEGKATGGWAFERGTIATQVVKRNPTEGEETRPAAAAGQEQGQAAGTQSREQGRAAGQAQASSASQPGDQPGSVVNDLNYYVMVLNKVNNDWRINWFVSTNPPEYVETVTSDQQQESRTIRGGQRGTPTPSQRSAE